MSYQLWLVSSTAATIFSCHFLEKLLFNLRHRFR